MYVGGTEDLMGFILMFPFLSAEDKEKQRAFIVQKATSRYFPVYEKVCSRIPSFHCSGRAPTGTVGVLREAGEVLAQYYKLDIVLSPGWTDEREVRAV